MIIGLVIGLLAIFTMSASAQFSIYTFKFDVLIDMDEVDKPTATNNSISVGLFANDERGKNDEADLIITNTTSKKLQRYKLTDVATLDTSTNSITFISRDENFSFSFGLLDDNNAAISVFDMKKMKSYVYAAQDDKRKQDNLKTYNTLLEKAKDNKLYGYEVSKVDLSL